MQSANREKFNNCVRFKLTLAKLILDYIDDDFFHYICGKIQRKHYFRIKDKFLLKMLQKGNMACTLLNPDELLDKVYTHLKKDGKDDIEEEEYHNYIIDFKKKKGQKQKLLSDKKAMKRVKIK